MYFQTNRAPINYEVVSARSPLNLIYLSKQYCQQDRLIPTARKLYRFKKKWRKITFQTNFVKCYICGNLLTSKSATMEHIIPISKGGIWNDIDNVKPACYRCNHKKSDSYEKLASNHQNTTS